MAEDIVSWKNPNGGGAATTQIKHHKAREDELQSLFEGYRNKRYRDYTFKNQL